MLNLTNIQNLEYEDLENLFFDVGIFASGYESRSIFLAQKLDPEKIKHKVILGFLEHKDDPTRQQNDLFYATKYCPPTLLSSNDQEALFEILRAVDKKNGESSHINLLMDYTSMARLWYSGILNYFRFIKERTVDIYINYSLGKYSKELIDYSYSSINSIPSLEGSLSTLNKTLLVLSVGFNPYLIKSVLEEIEPNQVIGILPTKSGLEEYNEQSHFIKTDILSTDIEDWVHSPIDDLESIFRTYAEITSFNINDKDIIFLSLGPKIFTLASILVSQRFDQVTCLYLKAKRSSSNIEASGKLICNKLSYRP